MTQATGAGITNGFYAMGQQGRGSARNLISNFREA